MKKAMSPQELRTRVRRRSNDWGLNELAEVPRMPKQQDPVVVTMKRGAFTKSQVNANPDINPDPNPDTNPTPDPNSDTNPDL